MGTSKFPFSRSARNTRGTKRRRAQQRAAIATAETLEGRTLFASVAGALVQYQPVQVDFAGPSSSETATAPNPFTDYRLNVTFKNAASGETFVVPGFFDGDGNGGGTGNVWRARFTPDQPGNWTYTASFRSGSKVAISTDPAAGSATSFNGESGNFNIGGRDPNAGGFLAHGRLEYVGGYYFQMQDGTYWVKGESNSPENYLGYQGFDGTTAGPYGIHKFASHVADWKTGDPDWGGGKGKAIIGSLNYLASTGINGIYVMPMNIGGDGQDAWPFVGPIDRAGSTSNDDLHYDISKLAQWNTFFSYANVKGIQVQMTLDETEEPNKRELDDATLGTERKVYYREMVARFGYLNALEWNVSEEYDHHYNLGYDRVLQFAGYIQDQDPYDHPITVMSRNDPRYYWTGFLGKDEISSTSFQFDTSPVRDIDIVPGTARYGADVEDWRKYSSDAGKKLPINIDEPGTTTPDNQVSQRKQLDYQTFFSGGSGLGIFGGKALDRDLDDFRTFDDSFKWLGYAVKFVQENLPFWQMSPSDGLLTGESSTYGGGQVFAKTNDTYAIYFPNATATGKLDLSAASGSFSATWFNPRTGKFEGSATTIAGGAQRSMPAPPSASSEDWVLLLKKAVTTNKAPVVNAGSDKTIALPNGASLSGSATDDGLPLNSSLAFTWSLVSGPGTVQFGNDHTAITTATFSTDGTYKLRLSADDGALASFDEVQITVNPQPVNQAPLVSAGPDRVGSVPNTVSLDGTVTDDGLPVGNAVTSAWSFVSGPGTVQFGNASIIDTTAKFSAAGDYVLHLSATDGQYTSGDDVAVHVNEQSSTDQVLFAPVGDSYVQGGVNANLKFGTQSTMLVKLGNADDTRQALLRFDISSFAGAVGAVKLRMSGRILDTRVASLATDVYGTSNPTWQESTVTWNLRPTNLSSKLGSMTVKGTTAAWYEVDVTNFVKAELAAGRTTIGLLLKNPTSSSPYSIFGSRESGATAPQLVVTPAGAVSNQAPTVNAGTDQTIALPASATLSGSASDDGLPSNLLTTTWSVVSGPGTVTFGDASQRHSSASFSVAGTYVLRLKADDGSLQSTDDVKIVVNPVSSLPTVTSLSLVDADTDQVIAGYESLTGGTINMKLSALPARLTIVANTSSILGSVKFTYDTTTKTENTAPYVLAGDDSGDYQPFNFTIGTHTLKAKAYGGSNVSGTAGNTITLTLNITK